MDTILGIIGPVFWGLLLLSALVFVHEGGHFLAARACGVRVLEFFLGMPCRYNIHRVSKKIGTKFGVTPILVGGYAEISGMDPTDVPCAPRVLGAIHRHGSVRVDELACELGLSVEDAEDACTLLYGWGSIVVSELEPAVGEGSDAASPKSPYVVAAPARDAAGNTLFDGRMFDRENASYEGDVWVPPMDDDAFFDRERSRTYIGKGFWKRAFMLVAGIAVNVVSGFLLVIAVYSVLGVSMPLDASVVGDVSTGSPAQAAGLREGDRILCVQGVQVDTWTGLLDALEEVGKDGTVQLDVWRPCDPDDAFGHLPFSGSEDSNSWACEHGDFLQLDVSFDEDGMLGIGVPEQTVRLDPLQSCRIAVDNIVATAESVMSLLNPSHTMEVLDNSTSVVGISVMSAEAAAAGPSTFLNFAALISFSLGFMNLLPIPPLDGGKLLIEAIQALTRRQVPIKVQTVISMIGIGLFGLLFVYMLGSDIIRFF